MSPSARPRSSLSPDPPSSAPARHRDGRTPPPAPSAGYARRARQIIGDETGVPVTKPMAMDDNGSEDSENPDAGYRRARAGTLPSRFKPAQNQTFPSDVPASHDTPTAFHSTPSTRTSALSPAYPTTPIRRPTLRHTASSNASLGSPTSANRLRSGSLTLPQNGIKYAFGSSAFSNAWLANPGLIAAQSRSPLGHRSEDLATYASSSGSAASLATDDLNFSTLDYLGLADGAEGQIPAASISEIRSQAQQAIANSGPASRLRANTVSNFTRPFRPSVTNANQYSRDHSPYGDRQDEDALARAIDHLGMYDPGLTLNSQLANLYAPTNLYKGEMNRPRATTIGALDNPMRRTGSRNTGYLAAIPQSPETSTFPSTIMGGPYGYPPRTRPDRDMNRSRDSSLSRGPRHTHSSHPSRAGTPDFGGSSTPQMPTRSLWIGNLDVNATSDALLNVFSPYGAIESVRMLPEKTCAFVNFCERNDAIRARDDVLNRMGGHVSALSETAPVRIGFGKIDSAPSGLPINTVAPDPAGFGSNGTPGSVNATRLYDVSVSPENGGDLSSSPTRALWIGSIPSTTSSAALLQIFSTFGSVESARVLMHKCCGFVNFERLDSAISARNALNGRDILGSDVGSIRINFARIRTTPIIGGPENDAVNGSPNIALEGSLSSVKGATAISAEQQLSAEGGGVENYHSQLVLDPVEAGVHEQVLERGLAHGGVVSEQQMIIQVLSAGRDEDGDVLAAADPRAQTTYYSAIPIISDRQVRRFDSARLKDLRKRLDSGMCSQDEIDGIAHDLLDDCAELASDYIGNTVVQGLFERTSPALRFRMLERIAPQLPMIGIHKNGTWAAQKIIECSVTDAERDLVAQYLRPFAPPLMCDSLGNYVCAGTLRFGEPFNGYVYDAMIDRMWDIAQNRFGARCIRTCLESPQTSLYQRKRIAAGIILNSIPLATSPNGALLLTWLVDQSNLPGRYGLLANRFVPHIASLCTHKLASLTVLRIITQTSEPIASSTLITALFSSPNDTTLMEVLCDANNGSQVIGKIMAISSLSSDDRSMMIETVRRILPNIKASSTPPYRLLLEAVGLPVPAGPIGAYPFSQVQIPGPGPGQGQDRGQGYWSQGLYPYHQPAGDSSGYQPPNLSPLLIPQNMPLGQSMRTGSPNQNGSPRTPQARHRGRMSPQSQMMSPGSDPFNPFASPSIDVPYLQSQGAIRLGSSLSQPPVTFDPQPNLGGLGMGMGMGMGGLHQDQRGQQMYYQNMRRQGMYAGFQG